MKRLNVSRRIKKKIQRIRGRKVFVFDSEFKYAKYLMLWLGLVDSIEETGVPFLVELQSLGAGDTSYSGTMETSDVLVWVAWVSNVSTEVWSTMGTFVWAFEGGGWCPWLGGDTIV